MEKVAKGNRAGITLKKKALQTDCELISLINVWRVRRNSP